MIACSDGVVIFINCIAERREHLGLATIAGTEGRISFCESRGIWEYGPLVDSEGGYGARYELAAIPDMPDVFKLDDYFYAAARESIDCLREDRERACQPVTTD